jgi:hypothetical protein|tara:strand:+ start:223 stop:495 length:273 start_codon:yes stop_codon:yes gene_type:complete
MTTTKLTELQKNTIGQLQGVIERLNGKQTVSVHNIRKGHILLFIGNTKDSVDWIRTKTYADVQINTKGNIVKGYFNKLSPKETVVYPYMD